MEFLGCKGDATFRSKEMSEFDRWYDNNFINWVINVHLIVA